MVIRFVFSTQNLFISLQSLKNKPVKGETLPFEKEFFCLNFEKRDFSYPPIDKEQKPSRLNLV